MAVGNARRQRPYCTSSSYVSTQLQMVSQFLGELEGQMEARSNEGPTVFEAMKVQIGYQDKVHFHAQEFGEKAGGEGL